MSEKKLFLLDGMALVYRAYFAFSQNPRVTSYGFNTSAIFGYTNTLLDVLKREKPTHLGVAFDTAAPTSRHLEFENYKANRQEQPEDITKALPYIMKITEALRFPIIMYDGYEADDIIGTLAKKAEQQGFTVYMMTPDKDFGQLVTETVFIYEPARLGNDVEIMGIPEVLKKWEISEVCQVIDILGLWGDAVDNIPGIPGVGEKTAKILIQKYGSIENLLAHTHELKGKQKENVEAHREQALLSKRLATIDINVPVDLDEQALIHEEPDREACEKLFTELEFKTLSKRLFGPAGAPAENERKSSGQSAIPFAASEQGDLFSQAPAAVQAPPQPDPGIQKKNIENTTHNYVLVDTAEKRSALLQDLLRQSEICFDTETSAIETMNADIVGLSFSYRASEAYYIPFPEDHEGSKQILEEFRSLFEHPEILKIGQNIKYDLGILKNYGLTLKGPIFDTMLAHYLIEPDLRHNMNYLAEIYLGYEPVPIEALIGKGKNQISMRNEEIGKIKEYAGEDADITLQIKHVLTPQLSGRNALKLFEEVELPLVEVLSEMEIAGVKINQQFLEAYSKELEIESAQLEKRIYELAGTQFNIASPRQLGEILFEKLLLDPKAKKTKTGQYQTGEDVLMRLSEHEIVRCVLDIRQLQKLKSTYVDSLPLNINPRTGRVHTCFSQAVAATGRLSSQNPNLQNIPIRTDKGKEVRKAFIPSKEGHVLLSADYSQIEFRIIAAIAEEQNMIGAFRTGIDIHTATAAKVYNIPIEEVDAAKRRNAKAVNFGIIYGQSPFGLSQSLGIPRKEAAEIIDAYFVQYPSIRKYMGDTIQYAREFGFVQTILGRRRYLRDINSANFTVRGFAERNAINAPIQGSAADMIKVAMIRIHNRMIESTEIRHSKMVLQVHDELLFDAHKDEVEALKQIVIHEMENAIPLTVPIKAEVGVGENWLEAH